MLLQLAEKLAELRNTEVLAHRYNEDGSELTFVLASGPKLTMSQEQLREAIRKAQPSEPFDYIEQAVAEEQKTGTPTAPPAADIPPQLMTGETPVPPKKKGKGKK